MHRGLVAAAGLLLAVSGIFVQAVALPYTTLACSCVAPAPSLDEIVSSGGDVAVIVGTVDKPLAEATPIRVEQWFHGARPADVVWLQGGETMVSSCDVSLAPGQSHFLVLYPATEELYSTNVCAPNAVIGSEQAAQLISEAEALFGAAQPPPTAEPQPPEREPDPDPGSVAPTGSQPEAGLLWVVAGVAAGVLLFGAVIFVGLRRPAR